MGARGTQAALEVADIALMTNDLDKIVLARAIARRAYRTIQENIFGGVGVVHGNIRQSRYQRERRCSLAILARVSAVSAMIGVAESG
jgi:cation transport ATPase